MKKSDSLESINIATLKAHLAKYLRMVRAGKEILITDRKQPVARIVPFDPSGALETLKPIGQFSEVSHLQPSKMKEHIDSLSYLLKERGKR